MSGTTTRLPLERAQGLAQRILDEMASHCDRIVVAGSIRRRVADIGDVEILAIPKTRRDLDLFGEPVGLPIDALHEYLEGLERSGTVRKRRDKNGRPAWGPKLKRISWPLDAIEIAVDLFCTSAETWGALLAIRTGPWEFSKRLVTQRAKGGICPNDMEFKDGGVWRYVGAYRRFVPTPDEETLFAEMGLPYVAPEHRFRTTFESVSEARR